MSLQSINSKITKSSKKDEFRTPGYTDEIAASRIIDDGRGEKPKVTNNVFSPMVNTKSPSANHDKTAADFSQSPGYQDIHLGNRSLPKNSSFDRLQANGKRQRPNDSSIPGVSLELDVRVEDFFLEGNSMKILHYFQPKSKNFYYLDLETLGPIPRNVLSLYYRLDSLRCC